MSQVNLYIIDNVPYMLGYNQCPYSLIRAYGVTPENFSAPLPMFGHFVLTSSQAMSRTSTPVTATITGTVSTPGNSERIVSTSHTEVSLVILNKAQCTRLMWINHRYYRLRIQDWKLMTSHILCVLQVSAN